MQQLSDIVVDTIPKGWELSVFADEISPSLEIQLAEVRRAGLPYFDLRSAFGKNVLDMADAEVREVRHMGEDYGLRMLCIGSPINKHPYNTEDRTREYDRLKRILEIADIAGSRYIRIFSPFLGKGDGYSPAPLPLNSAEDVAQGKAESRPSYEAIRVWIADQIRLAQKADKVLLLENDGDAYGAFPENAKRLFAELGCPYFQAAFDFSNAVLLGYPAFPFWFPWIMPYLGALHIKDSVFAKDEDGQEQIVPAGEGEGNVREVLELVVSEGWSGPVSLEPHLFRLGKKMGLDGVQQFRMAVEGLNRCL